MRKNLICLIMGILTVTLMVFPVSAWYYNNIPTPTDPSSPPHDSNFETFGPRCDRMLIKLYSTAEGEWDALLATPQEIDMTDWPLTQGYFDTFKVVPEINRTNLVASGGEFGIRCLDMNQNGERYLGEPPNPNYPNPVRNLNDTDPKNDNNPTSDLNFRKAILSCIDRAYYVANIIGTLSGVELWCCLPPAMGIQYYNDTYMKTMYPFSLDNARNFLEAGNFKINATPGIGYRYWDLDDDDIEDPQESVALKFIIRSDDVHRLHCGNHLADELSGRGSAYGEPEGCNINVSRLYLDISGARVQWKENKDAHLYTAAWSLGIEPTSITLWCIDNYWHPRRCGNTAKANDPEFNEAARRVEVAGTEEEAVTNMEICNRRAAEAALNGPMYCYSSVYANARKYAGGTPDDAPYVGKYWNGTVCVRGYGIDSYFSFLNMYPQDFDRPENGTIRYGFKTTDIRSFNTIYADVLWDNKVLDLCYDNLVKSDPYSLTTRMPWMCSNYTVGSYIHPTLGNCTKVKFTLRPDMTWTDGTPITLNDVYFTLVEVKDILRTRGFPNPWWYSGVKNILSFKQIDPYNFEVLTNVYSIWAFGLAGTGIRIMPEHVWRPICETGDPTTVAPDPNMIGSGPWRFREYVAAGYVELLANKPGRTVQTSHAGSTPITSPKGYFRYSPIDVIVKADSGYHQRFFEGDHTLSVTMFNRWYSGAITIDKNITITFHNGTKVILAEQTGLTIPSQSSHEETFTFNWPWGRHIVEVSFNITAPSVFAYTKKVTLPYWVTLEEDIGGGLWNGVTAPDINVKGQDLAIVSLAFGTKPGDPRWSSVGDVNNDYLIGPKDQARIAARFGWSGGGIAAHSIAVSGIQLSKTVLCQGYAANITVVIENYGLYAETFNVTLYANSTSIALQQVNLEPATSMNITFACNSTSLAKGNYTIKAVADPVQEEVSIEDNTLIDGWLTVTILGDVNGDFMCEGKDIALVSKAYGTRIGQAGYLPNADINCDGQVEGKDVAIASKYYGTHDP